MIIKHYTNKYFYQAIRKLFLREFPPSPKQIYKALTVLRIVSGGEKKRRKNQIRYDLPIPYACVFSVTWKCNLKCIGCYAKHYPAGNQLNIKEIENIIAQCDSLGTYIFIVVGGEPLIIPGIIEILSRAKNTLFFLFTNGTLIDTEKILLLKKAKNIIPIISTEGNDSFVDLRRGEGMGETVNTVLSLFKKHNVLFGFSSMITHKNINEVLTVKWVNSLWAYGAKFGFIIDYIPFPKTKDESLVLTVDDMMSKKEKIKHLNSYSKVTLFNFPEDEYRQTGCKAAGNGFVHINANGNVEPCPFSHYAVDNIRDKSLLEVLNSEFFKRLRATFQDKDNETKSCMLFYNDDLVKEIAKETNAFCTEKEEIKNSVTAPTPE